MNADQIKTLDDLETFLGKGKLEKLFLLHYLRLIDKRIGGDGEEDLHLFD